ncbi:MAG: sensor histidine kinase [Cyclobacteriaceae bacterium]|jgi:two-component system phosphate regulon sensor histidine kinase PhoR
MNQKGRYLCMVNPKKNRLTLLLMCTSIGLLLVLQVVWLTSTYEKAFYDLRKETSTLFEMTVSAMRDSLISGSIQRVPNDSVQSVFFRQPIDSLVGKNQRMRMNINKQSSQVQIIISSTDSRDSLNQFIRPLSAQIRKGKIDNGNFVFRLGPDSLRIDSIEINFKKALRKANLPSEFLVLKKSFLPPPMSMNHFKDIFRSEQKARKHEEVNSHPFADQFQTDWAQFNPAFRYAATVQHFRNFLLAEIMPQILFSVFLSTLTIGAFIVMYKSIRAQQRLAELKNDFISNMTHELKTPVTTVGVAIEALKNFNGIENKELTDEYLTIAQNELNRLSLLTDKILKTAIFENKGVDFQPENVHFDQIIDQVLTSMKLVFEKNKAIVSFEKIGSHFELRGGQVHLTNVIYNLLDNALKYSGENAMIEIRLHEMGHELKLSVTDNGIGIAPEYKKKIFEKFFRVPSGDVHNSKGYGLGLSYVDSVIKAHHGKLVVESEIGKGSTFTIVLNKS